MNIADVVKRLSDKPPQTVLVFVGAGFTSDLGFPLWKPLIAKLADFVEPIWAPHAATIRHRLDAGDLIASADPAFEREIPANDRARFFKSVFERHPALNRRHRLLGALPVAGFVTTNFDPVIEGTVHDRGRIGTVFRGADRFTTFNSNLPTYTQNHAVRWEKEAYVLKIHNDAIAPEHMVLNSATFRDLPETPGFRQFFEVALRSYHILFVGFSGEDPNLLERVGDLFGQYAGFGPADSFLVLPNGSRVPDALTGTNIHGAFYDPKDNHAAIEDLLKQLNDAWRATIQRSVSEARTEKDLQKQAQRLTIEAAASDLDAVQLNIFELMAVSFKSGSDERILDSVARALVGAAVAAAPAGEGANVRVVSNLLGQKYRVSPERADALVAKYLGSAEPPSTRAAAVRPLQVLTGGLRQRCLAHDPDFLPNERALEPVVRSTVEFALQAYGCSVALALVNGDRPLLSELSDVVRTILRQHTWDRIGELEREALSLALPDLFLRSTEEEAKVLSRLAVAATAFGLIQALPLADLGAASLAPAAVYLDTTCALPLLTKAEPRFGAYKALLPLADNLGVELLFLRTFLNEITSHFSLAKAHIRDRELDTVGKLRDYLAGGLEEYANVFLVMLAQGGYEPGDQPLRVLDRLFGRGAVEEFARRLEQARVKLVDAHAAAPGVLEALGSRIVVSKKNWYERSADVRTILARNEALQLLHLQADAAQGRRTWFATGDAQLRRVVRENGMPGSNYVLPVGGVIALLETLCAGEDLSPAFPRMLWNPDISDQIDQQLSAELKKLLAAGAAPGVRRLPIETARKLAFEEYTRRARADRAPEDLEVDTAPPDTHARVRESVFLGLGRAIEEAKREEERRSPPRAPSRPPKRRR